jgi:hypothetical protein
VFGRAKKLILKISIAKAADIGRIWLLRTWEYNRYEKRNTSGIPESDGSLRVRKYVRDPQYDEGNPRGNMLDVPSVLHRQAKVH